MYNIFFSAQDICDLVLLDGFPSMKISTKQAKQSSSASNRASNNSTPNKRKPDKENGVKNNILLEKSFSKPYLELAASVPSNHKSLARSHTCPSPPKSSHSFREQRHPYARGRFYQ